MFVFLCGCHANMCEGAPCAIIEFCHNVFWAIFYVIAACVAAASAGETNDYPRFTAGAVFGFIVVTLYLIHSLTSYRDWRGNYPCYQ